MIHVVAHFQKNHLFREWAGDPWTIDLLRSQGIELESMSDENEAQTRMQDTKKIDLLIIDQEYFRNSKIDQMQFCRRHHPNVKTGSCEEVHNFRSTHEIEFLRRYYDVTAFGWNHGIAGLVAACLHQLELISKDTREHLDRTESSHYADN